ncbi:MAG: hypothetical protein CMH70_05480 [Nitrosomonadaceae bacterium]|nr:hypothetical protein [Nitrosomonadaceae bacterium]
MLSLLRQLLKDILQKFGLKVAILFLLMILAGLLDGLGMILLLPLFNLIGVTTNEVGLIHVFMERLVSFFGFSMDIKSVVAFIILAFLIQALLVITKDWLMARVETVYVDEWRSCLMKLFLNASWPFFVKNKLGSLVNLIVVQTEQVGRAFFGFAELMVAIFMVTIYVLLSFIISWEFTFFLITASALFWVICLFPFVKLSYKSGTKYTEFLDTMQVIATDYISSAKLIKATGTEKTALNNFGKALYKVKEEYFKATFFPHALKVLMEFSAIIFLCSFLLIGVKYLGVQAGVILVLLGIFFRMVPKLFHAYSSLQLLGRFLPSFARISMYQCNAITSSENLDTRDVATRKFSKSLDISIDKVTVSYDKKIVLSNFSVKIPPYQTLGIIGGSGAGKTTLVDCILGLIKPESGQIRINDIVLDEISLSEWRRSIGYVTQETVLFHDTVGANIKWGNEDVSDSELFDAAKKAYAHDFIQSLPNGYDTIVGDKGVCLSGGQRQRLALARALLGQPALLIFDEATNSLDSISEKEVLDAIYRLKMHITIIMISHRLSTLKNAEKIIVLGQGGIVDEGTWHDLESRSEHISEVLKTPGG